MTVRWGRPGGGAEFFPFNRFGVPPCWRAYVFLAKQEKVRCPARAEPFANYKAVSTKHGFQPTRQCCLTERHCPKSTYFRIFPPCPITVSSTKREPSRVPGP